MTDTPKSERQYDAEMIPIETVRPGYSLAVEVGDGRQLFQVESTGFTTKQQDDCSHRKLINLTSDTPADGSDPWGIESPPGTTVCRLLRAR